MAPRGCLVPGSRAGAPTACSPGREGEAAKTPPAASRAPNHVAFKQPWIEALLRKADPRTFCSPKYSGFQVILWPCQECGVLLACTKCSGVKIFIWLWLGWRCLYVCVCGGGMRVCVCFRETKALIFTSSSAPQPTWERVHLDFGNICLDSTMVPKDAESGRDTDGWIQPVVASPRERGGRVDVFLEVNSTPSWALGISCPSN